ncbi:DUF4406 domain-containing protein [Aeromonas sp. s5]|uniref:DUF4406 domain-containing protein n=1 Tax=Aeromonas sp. s5 TaxID=3138487 RepID=UPI0034A33299
MKIYIAGPMTGHNKFYKPAFNRIGDQIERQGDIALNPAVLPPGLSNEEYLNICMAMLDVADEVVMLPNWKYTELAVKQHDRATQRGMKITYLEALV